MPRVWRTNPRKYGAMPLLRYSYASRLQDVGYPRSCGGRGCDYGDNTRGNATVD